MKRYDNLDIPLSIIAIRMNIPKKQNQNLSLQEGSLRLEGTPRILSDFETAIMRKGSLHSPTSTLPKASAYPHPPSTPAQRLAKTTPRTCSKHRARAVWHGIGCLIAAVEGVVCLIC